MAEQAQLLRPTDDEARELARSLVRSAPYMSLAVIDAKSGFPSASRALTAIDLDGTPVVLVSALAGHTAGMLAEPRCSLLAGEPGKGDPLAHARISVQCLAEAVERDGAAHARIRERFLQRHSKARLYADFPDFRYFRLAPQQASLNGGFGRAFAVSGDDLLLAPVDDETTWMELLQTLSRDRSLAPAMAIRLGLAGKNWRFGLVDPGGFDLISTDMLVRHEFDDPKYLPKDVMNYIFEKSKVQ